jgi:hypothetical protein
MENKIISQEWKLIDELLELVNSQEEYEYLLARAKEICPESRTAGERQRCGVPLVFSLSLKGGAA